MVCFLPGRYLDVPSWDPTLETKRPPSNGGCFFVGGPSLAVEKVSCWISMGIENYQYENTKTTKQRQQQQQQQQQQ